MEPTVLPTVSYRGRRRRQRQGLKPAGQSRLYGWPVVVPAHPGSPAAFSPEVGGPPRRLPCGVGGTEISRGGHDLRTQGRLPFSTSDWISPAVCRQLAFSSG